MKSKSRHIFPVTTLFISAFAFSSCETKGKEPQNAFDEYKENKIQSTDSLLLKNQNEAGKQKVISTETKPSEWQVFKTVAENKIQTNAKKISELNKLPDQSIKTQSKINRLEKENNEIKTQLDEYEKEVNQKWELFKTNTNSKLDEVSNELKEITPSKKQKRNRNQQIPVFHFRSGG